MMKEGIKLDIILFFIFLVAKLSGGINWSWWLITLPLYIGPAILIITGLIIMTGIFIGMISEKINKK